MSSPIRVFVRTRPSASFASDNIMINSDAGSIAIHMAKQPGQAVNNQVEDWQFKVQEILHNASQQRVYDRVAHGLVKALLEGQSATIMAYGQTGAGKSFTIHGAGTGGSSPSHAYAHALAQSQAQYEYRGLAPRALQELFQLIRSRSDLAVSVRVSYMEIYGEQLIDLLANSAGADSPPLPLACREDERGELQIKNLLTPAVHSEEEALKYLFEGEANRSMAHHRLNESSTRSHCFFKIYVEAQSLVESSERRVTGVLQLVDLAGSERIKRTNTSGAALEEAKCINKSLSFLEHVVVTMNKNNREHTPFRQSKLTNCLRDCLGGHHRTRLIACIYTEQAHLAETISTLRFASRMGRINNTPRVSVDVDPQAVIDKQSRQIKELQQEVRLQQQLNNREATRFDAFTPEEQRAIRRSLVSFMSGQADDIDIVSVRQVKEMLRQIKAMTNKGETWNTQEDAEISKISAQSSSPAAAADAANGIAGVGLLEDAVSGLSLGAAGAADGPNNRTNTNAHAHTMLPNIKIQARRNEEKTQISANSTAPVGHSQAATARPHRPLAPAHAVDAPSEAAALEAFQRGAGASLFAACEASKREERAIRAAIKENHDKINKDKREIERLSEEAQQHDQPADSLVAARQRYAACVSEDRRLRSSLDAQRALSQSARVALCESFIAHAHGASPLARADDDDDGDDADALDDGERFDRLEAARVASSAPEAINYYYAHKAMEKKKRTNKGVRKQAIKPKAKFY